MNDLKKAVSRNSCCLFTSKNRHELRCEVSQLYTFYYRNDFSDNVTGGALQYNTLLV